MPEAINAAGIPGANLRPDMVEIAATEMSAIGDKVGTQAATVVTTWQRLAAHYDAPEDTTLFRVMDPVKANGETFDANIGKVSSALKVYAAEVEPIKAELARIKTEATTFLGDIAGGVEQKYGTRMGVSTRTVDWHEDQDSIDANKALIGRVDDQMELLWAAERKCANAIYDIIGFPHIQAATESNPNGYGVEDIPEGAERPWGTPVEKTESCGEKTVGAVKGFVWDGVVVDGLWGTVVGLGTLTLGYNPQTGEWFSGDAYAAGWSNLGMLAVGLGTAGVLPAIVISQLPDGPVKDFLVKGQETLLAAGKGLIAWDTWSEDPARAAGASVFNVATIIIPVGAATAPVRVSASTAAAAIRTTAKVVNLLDPVTLIGRGGGAAIRIAMPSVSDALRTLDFSGAGSRIDIPDLPPTRSVDIPTVDRSDMTVDTPRVDGDVDVPVRTPEDAVSAPPVREPELAGVGGRGGDGGTVTVGSGGGGGAGGADLPGSGSAGGGGKGGGDLPPSGAAGSGSGAPDGNGATNGGSTGGGNGGGPTGNGMLTPGQGTPWNPEMGDPTLSPADHGPGFERDLGHRGNPDDPNYGQPRPTGESGQLAGWQVPPNLDDIPPEVRELVTDTNAPYGRDASGQPYSRPEFEQRYTDANGDYVYPGNDGAVPGSRIDFDSADEFTAHYGDVLDRMGARRGDFLSFPGTPFEARGLPGSNLEGGAGSPYLTMRLTGDLPPNLRIEVSEVAPAFGREGGGLQVRVIEVNPDGTLRLRPDGSVTALSVRELQTRGVVELVGDTGKMPPGTAIADQPSTHYSDRWDQPDLHGDGPDGSSGPDGNGPDGGSDPDGSGPQDRGEDPTPPHPDADGVGGEGDSRLNGAGAEQGLDPTPETIRTGLVRMEDHPDYPTTVVRLEELGYTVREVAPGGDPRVSIVHLHDGPRGPVIGIDRAVNVIPQMRWLDLEHEIGHVEQMIDPSRFPDGPPATDHGYVDQHGNVRVIKNQFPELTVRQNDIIEYHVRLEEWIRLHERGVPAEVLDQHRGGLLEQREKYLKRVKHDLGLRSWRDEHFSDVSDLEAKARELGVI